MIMTRIALIAACLAACGARQDDKPPPEQPKNRLAKEQSPYLRQHADNPVDWYPWGEEAFDKAKREDKPIFLSIGYSTCHWCHVMERESFMNEAIAKFLNEHFVSVKLDREERPDVDQIYMTACQAMTGSGGWPLSAFLTHDRKPFFVGTYFPPKDRWGQPGFESLLKKIDEGWKTRRKELVAGAEELTESLKNADSGGAGGLDRNLLDAALKSLKERFDDTHAGFHGRNKFPRSITHELLLRLHRRTGDARALEMVERTLVAMRRGGMFDQLGGGFHRYSTDAKWLVPHFEKMLYDNALLARAYVQAYQASRKEEYAQVARETLDYILRDLTSKEGGFFSAEDADSDLPGGGHAEGAFYVWTPEQIRAVVPGAEGDLICRALGVVPGGNFEPVEEEEPKGNSVLHVAADLTDDEKRRVEVAKRKLFDARSRRPRPHLDDKILTDWNGLTIGAMAFCGAVLEEPRYVRAAERAARFLIEKLRRPDGRWLHRYRDGTAGIPGFLEDYAFVAEGFFLLHQATFRTEHLEVSVRTAELMIEDFSDPAGGFFMTAKSAEPLIARMKDPYDGAIPSGNSAAALTLLRLGDLCSRPEFRKAAEETLKHFAGSYARLTDGYPYHLCAFDGLLGPSQEIVLVGESREMLRAIRRAYLPNAVVAGIPLAGPDEATRRLIPMTADRPALEGRATAYVCENYGCKAPTTSVETLQGQIK
jgi:uncharacterized protein YyaL (SSP411 family)